MNTIDAKGALDLLTKKQAILVDVREPDEFKQEHIPYAVSIPLSQLEAVFEQWPFGDEEVILFQCQKGMRGEKACIYLDETNNNNAKTINMVGGIEAWKSAGLATISTKFVPEKLSIMRQVQITVGILILLFTAIGFTGVSSAFMLSGVIGAGLLFSGLTGWCGLGILLNKMPWNN